jgi:tetratricopeptide (TPR) repeat protein
VRSLRLSVLLLASCTLASCAQLGRLVARVTPDRSGDGNPGATIAETPAEEQTNEGIAGGKAKGGTASASRGTRKTKTGPADLAGLSPTDATADSASAPVPAPPAVDPEIGRIYAEGLAAQKSGRYDFALESWERVWAEAPDYEDVADLLLKEYLVRGLEQFATGSLDLAIASWEKARRIRPESPRVQAYLAKAREQRERTAPVE